MTIISIINMMFLNTFILVVSFVIVDSQIPQTCRKLSACSCIDEYNRIVNLTALASKINPRFKDYNTAGGENYKYSWNPCYNFEEGPENEKCINVGACRISPHGGYSGIGQAETVEFSHDDNGNLSLVMTNNDGETKTETHVILYCDWKTEAHFRVLGEVSPGIYWLQLWSKYSCPIHQESDDNSDDVTMPTMAPHTMQPVPHPVTMPAPGVVTMTSKPSSDTKALTDIEIILFCILVMVALILLVLLTRFTLKLMSTIKPQRSMYELLPHYDVEDYQSK